MRRDMTVHSPDSTIIMGKCEAALALSLFKIIYGGMSRRGRKNSLTSVRWGEGDLVKITNMLSVSEILTDHRGSLL